LLGSYFTKKEKKTEKNMTHRICSQTKYYHTNIKLADELLFLYFLCNQRIVGYITYQQARPRAKDGEARALGITF